MHRLVGLVGLVSLVLLVVISLLVAGVFLFRQQELEENPLLEEWYYIDDSADYPNVHFRHRRKANVLSCDGHVNGESPVPGSIDARLPNQNVGRLPDALLFVQ